MEAPLEGNGGMMTAYKDNYEDKLREILAEGMVGWEETSESYTLLLAIRQSGKRAVVFYKDLNEISLGLVKRYFSNMNIPAKMIWLSDRTEGAKEIENLAAHAGETLLFRMSGLYPGKKYAGHNPLRHLKQWAGMNLKLAREMRAWLFKDPLYCLKMRKLWKAAVTLQLPFVRERGEEIKNYVEENFERFLALLNRLEDEKSRETLIEVIRAAVSDDVYRGSEGSQYEKYWECYEHRDDEVLVNCGSAKGDTILKFLHQEYSYERIYAFEGDEAEYRGLLKILAVLPEKDRKKISAMQEYIGLDDSKENFDNRFMQSKVTLINMDIEGAEMGVLQGAKELIAKQRPVLAVCAYHKASDLIQIPDFIDSTAEKYHIYLRKYIGFEPDTLNEYLFYLIPEERLQKNAEGRKRTENA